MKLVNRLSDGTVKHFNFFTGREAWALPGRDRRPVAHEVPPGNHLCNFCPDRYRFTPPEKSRLVKRDGKYVEQRGLAPGETLDKPAEFRRIANLFEILSLDYWTKNHGFEPAQEVLDRQAEYLDDGDGREHVKTVLRLKLGRDPTSAEVRDLSLPFFAGSHELIVARRHRVGGAPCSSGDLTEAEHRAFVRFSFDAVSEIERLNPHVEQVTLFQNWLQPAGASFDHLHKQLVGAGTLALEKRDPSLFDRYLEQAEREDLVIAALDRAVVVADTGRPHPTVMVVARDPSVRPEELSEPVRACHAAWDRKIPSNEEWHHATRGVPVHVVLRWRLNIPAGFEGATGIHINPMEPHAVRDETVAGLRNQGLLGY